MRTKIKTAMLAAMMMTALSAAAQVTTLTQDPLMKQILSKQLTQHAGGITGSVRIGSGQAITLNIIDPLATLKPIEGLVEKPVKKTARRKSRRDAEQLKKMSEEQRRADWSGHN